MIGPNGAGKTTLFNCISGLYPPPGEVTFDGQPLEGAPAAGPAGAGAHLPDPRLFRSLPVGDNLVLGCRVADAAGRTYRFDPRSTRMPRRSGPSASPNWSATRAPDAPAASLSFGELRVVELARALCAAP